METKILAVTVSKYYVNPDMYGVKALTVGINKHGDMYWHVVRTMRVFPCLSAAHYNASALANQLKVPYIPYITHGQVVSESDIKELRQIKP